MVVALKLILKGNKDYFIDKKIKILLYLGIIMVINLCLVIIVPIVYLQELGSNYWGGIIFVLIMCLFIFLAAYSFSFHAVFIIKDSIIEITPFNKRIIQFVNSKYCYLNQGQYIPHDYLQKKVIVDGKKQRVNNTYMYLTFLSDKITNYNEMRYRRFRKNNKSKYQFSLYYNSKVIGIVMEKYEGNIYINKNMIENEFFLARFIEKYQERIILTE